MDLRQRRTEGLEPLTDERYDAEALEKAMDEIHPSAAALGNSTMEGFLHKYQEQCGGCFPCFKPTWQRRYFILKGQFIFRYASPSGKKPKGTPIPIESMSVSEDNDTIGPDGRRYCFVLSSIRKDFIISAGSADERSAWIRAIRAAKERSIKERMGHLPMSAGDRTANKAGSYLFKQQLDFERQHVMPQGHMAQVEMASFN
eukprot:GILJ01009365.1.p1 GENE.GILJ01009365.1~~GILJ01009365.1.p1  ORF type:complete len:201 (-),score=25.87 GILJ01009365.1:176-778(-)